MPRIPILYGMSTFTRTKTEVTGLLGEGAAPQGRNGPREGQGTEREIYLDYNGSAPLDPRVARVMVPVLTERLGNAVEPYSTR